MVRACGSYPQCPGFKSLRRHQQTNPFRARGAERVYFMAIPKIIEKTTRTVESCGMVAGAKLVLAAVSGGPDSVCMLHLLRSLSDRYGFKLAVAHMNHGFRPESASEAVFVREIAEGFGLPCVVEEAHLGERLAGLPVNCQDEARKVRYDFLERAADEIGADRIAVGHNADDQAETWIMRVIRGAGAKGLSAIPPVRGRIIRPLLDITREEIMEYLSENGIGYVTDKSNLKTVYLRNSLRMRLMPMVKEYNPEAVTALVHSAEILRQEDNLLDSLANDALSRISAEKDGLLRIDAAGFCALHEALKRRVVRLACARTKGDTLGLSYGHVIDAVRLLTGSGTGKGIDLPGGVRVETGYGEVVFRRESAAPEGFRVELHIPGTARVPSGTITAEVCSGALSGHGGSVAFIDMERLTGPLFVRNREDGDLFHPAGMDGRKKLKEYFIDKKVPRGERGRVPIVVCGDDIVWVAGFRADGRFAARQGAPHVVRLSLLNDKVI